MKPDDDSDLDDDYSQSGDTEEVKMDTKDNEVGKLEFNDSYSQDDDDDGFENSS